MTTAPAGSPRVVAVSRAVPGYVDIRGKRVLTSIVREASRTPLLLEPGGAEGNRTAVHTEHLLGFSREHYAYWARRFGLASDAWPLAFWGENVVFRGLFEENLPVGTILRVGPTAVLQVTSPRNPCFKLSWRIGQPDAVLPDILASGRCGFYMRVIVPGPLFEGDAVAVLPPARPAVTVADVAQVMGGAVEATPDRMREILATEGLGVQCAGMLRQRLTDLLDRDGASRHRWRGWRPFTVARKWRAARGVQSFELRAVDGEPLAGFRAGQHVRVRLGPPGARAWTRAWSLSDYADRPEHYRVSIKRSDRAAASAHMHDDVAVGSVVELGAPAGSFHLDRASNHPTILIGAGIGLTPLLAMLKAYAALGSDAPPVHLIYVTRNSDTYAHRDEVEALARDRPNVLRHVRFTQPLATDRIGHEYDARGRLTRKALRQLVSVYRYPIFGREVELPGAAGEFYLCGPRAFEDDVRAALESLGAAPAAIRSESFGLDSSAGLEAARVRFARSGIEVRWEPGASLLETAEDAGIGAEHECRAGTCHRCAVAVLEGAVAYDRRPAVAPEPGLALVCCSRPATAALVLDL